MDKSRNTLLRVTFKIREKKHCPVTLEMVIYRIVLQTSSADSNMKYNKINGGKQTWYTIYDYINVKILNMTRYMIFQYCSEPVLIQRMLIGSEAILKNITVNFS